MKLIVIIIFSLLSSTLFAQNELIMGSGSATYIHNKNESVDADALGTPYINDEYLPATINYVNKGDVYTESLRYNAVDDEMEFENKGQLYRLEKQNGLIIDFVTQEYICKSYQEGGTEHLGYFQNILTKEALALYTKKEIKYIPKRKATSAYTKDTPAQYQRAKDKFYVDIGNKITEIPSSRKKASKLFLNKEDDVFKFLKKNKINTQDKKDLIKLVEFVDNLK